MINDKIFSIVKKFNKDNDLNLNVKSIMSTKNPNVFIVNLQESNNEGKIALDPYHKLYVDEEKIEEYCVSEDFNEFKYSQNHIVYLNN